MAIGDVYEVIDAQVFGGKDVLNVYFYQALDAGVTADLVGDMWINQVLPDVQNVQGADVSHTEVRVRNLFNLADVAVIPTGVLGTSVAAGVDTMPPHDAIAFKLTRGNASTRHGQKRIAGIPATNQTDGVIDNSTYIVELGELADAMLEQLVDTVGALGNFALPIIVGRIAEVVLGVTEYRLPENLGELVSASIVDVVVDLFISTQNSRKL